MSGEDVVGMIIIIIVVVMVIGIFREWRLTTLPVHESPPEAPAPTPPLRFKYKNHRGFVSFRTVIPKSIRWGSTEWHPEKQWIMRAWCTEKKAMRDFAMKDMVDGHS